MTAMENVGCNFPLATMPLGTGNDLARTLRWGHGLTGSMRREQWLQRVASASIVGLDRWCASPPGQGLGPGGEGKEARVVVVWVAGARTAGARVAGARVAGARCQGARARAAARWLVNPPCNLNPNQARPAVRLQGAGHGPTAHLRRGATDTSLRRLELDRQHGACRQHGA